MKLLVTCQNLAYDIYLTKDKTPKNNKKLKNPFKSCEVQLATLAHDIPKGKIFDVVKALKDVEIPAPVKIGDVVIADVAGTGVDIVATKNVD